MCDLDINFLETKNKMIIVNLVNIKSVNEVGSEYSWFDGLKNKSYGGFVKKIANNNLKGLIIPNIRKIKLKISRANILFSLPWLTSEINPCPSHRRRVGGRGFHGRNGN